MLAANCTRPPFEGRRSVRADVVHFVRHTTSGSNKCSYSKFGRPTLSNGSLRNTRLKCKQKGTSLSFWFTLGKSWIKNLPVKTATSASWSIIVGDFDRTRLMSTRKARWKCWQTKWARIHRKKWNFKNKWRACATEKGERMREKERVIVSHSTMAVFGSAFGSKLNSSDTSKLRPLGRNKSHSPVQWYKVRSSRPIAWQNLPTQK